jgi:hypothetical protein
VYEKPFFCLVIRVNTAFSYVTSQRLYDEALDRLALEPKGSQVYDGLQAPYTALGWIGIMWLITDVSLMAMSIYGLYKYIQTM